MRTLKWTSAAIVLAASAAAAQPLRDVNGTDYGALGDTTTLADPTVVSDLIDKRQNK